MTKQPPPAMSWGVVIIIVIIGALFAVSLTISNTREAECKARGGTFLQSRAGSTCVRDGKIVIVWQNGQRIDNP